MVKPSLDPTRLDRSDLSTFSCGCEGIPCVLKQYRISPHRYTFPIRWSNQLNQSEKRTYAPLTWITTDPGNDWVSARRQAIVWTNFHSIINCTLRNTLQWFFSSLKKMHLEIMGKLVVIVSRPQCVKYGIDLYPYPTVMYMYPPNGYTCKRVNKTPEKLLLPTHVIIATIKTRCMHENSMCSRPIYWLGCFKRHFSMKKGIPWNDNKMLQSFTKILVYLVWWKMLNIAS